MKVLKFGGSSVAKPERIENIVKIVSEILETQTVAVVVSAFGGCTDDLLNMAQLALKQDQEAFELFDKVKARHFDAAEALLSAKAAVFDKAKDHLNKQFDQLHEVLRGVNMLQELSDRTLDLVASFGERLSAYIIAQAFSVNGVLADFLDARDLVVTNSNFLAAKVDFEKTDQNIADYFASKQNLQIITGFVARDSEGNTTTLGRGGSDYTASIFGAALNAEEVQIWTDVDGIMTADPRKVKSAFTLRSVTYQEAMEMSHFGAKVIYSPTMRPVMKKSIPLRIKNTLTPSAQGSVIGNENDVSGPIVKGVSSINDISLLRVQGSGLQGVLGFSSRLFGSLARAEVNIVLITQASSEYSICFAVVPKDAQRAKEVLEQEFIYEMREGQVDKVVVENDLAIVAVVGENMKNLPGVSGKIFKSLGENGVNVKAIAQGSSELNISIVIDKKQIEKSLNVIHDSLFLSDLKTLNVFLVGPGLVGKTLLQQLSENKNSLLNNQKIQLKLVALMNSQNMTFAQEGLDFTAWQQALENGEKANLDQFIEKMKSLNLANSVLVDCTSSEVVAQKYAEVLEASISVVTPNKKANSANIRDYLNLSRAAAKSNAKFYYETNVGAGLPVIKTLHDIQLSGDRVQKIEAVLSGTLSYLFNNYDGSKPFSELLKEAKEMGFTEPDPRDDLSGMDVARKILILARETNTLLQLEDIEVENLVPESCRSGSISQFFDGLKKYDDAFLQRYQKAKEEGKKLVYMASFEDGRAKVGLQEVADCSPFYGLSGSDNMIVFNTNHYSARPLVIRGPGAGADVTAAGVFADLLRIANLSFNTQMTKYSFIDKLKNNNLKIALVGMSNIGKTHWSQQLSKLGFSHLSCDDDIELRLEPLLKDRGYRGIADVSRWLGQPYDKGFKEKEQAYLEQENLSMKDLIQKLRNSDENVVLDTTGSVIYTNAEVLDQLKKETLVIYIEEDPEMKERMLQKYLAEPKPVLWMNNFTKKPGESDEEALKRSYSALLKERFNLYSDLADVVLPYSTLSDSKINQHQFLSLIQAQL